MHLTVSSPYPILWRTNIPHIVRSKNSHYTQRLVISSRGCTIDYSSLGDILGVFGFSTVEWLRLEKICFIEDPQAAKQDSDTEPPITDDIRERPLQPSQYFVTHIPHGKHLCRSVSMYPVKNPPVFPLGYMLNFYLPRLQTRIESNFILSELDSTCFSSYIARLVLHINSKSAEGFPKIFAPSLEILALFYSDIAHSWHIFRGSLPGSVIFENLTELAIYHYPKIIGSSEESRTYFSPILFPKLKENVPVLAVVILGRKDNAHSEAAGSIAKDLFSKPFSTFTAELHIQKSLPVALPDTILWTKLEKLYPRFPVYFSDLIHILPQLPRLRWLIVGAIYYTGHCIENTESVQIWNSILTQLILFSSTGVIPTIPSLDAMCNLVSGLPSLLKLAVPEDMLTSAIDALSTHAISRESNEGVLQVVGYRQKRGMILS
ncbi:hypothetical protein DL89DRAFT_267034 [Linderina pennispora]|uniref:Uncharacterized protein n=1 Tax=Linderina pennispora TaxID=61395 RepID=A0A1Y1WCH2_9FUNG|nr:uncharacterized protein DL89DRAFT_267034 [Linderina pennispora]ORX70926.1 hypothetical protein DL89DRAFT_267034 [Linderina pennispora]